MAIKAGIFVVTFVWFSVLIYLSTAFWMWEFPLDFPNWDKGGRFFYLYSHLIAIPLSVGAAELFNKRG